MSVVTMKQALKLILPLVILVEVVLVWSGIVRLGDAILVIAVLETLFVLVGLGGLILVVKRYRRGRETGSDPLRALEDGLCIVLPGMVSRLVMHEPRIFVALFKWIFRRVRIPNDEFSYHKRSLLRSLMPMLVLVLPVELLVVHLLVYGLSPWAWMSWVLVGLEIYAFFWILGLYATLVTLPYRLEDTGLRLRYGLFAEAFVPYEQIEHVVRKERQAPSSGDGLQHDPEEDSLYLAASGKTDITLYLRSPKSALGFVKESKSASCFHLAADEPERFTLEIHRRIDDHQSKISEKQLEGSSTEVS